MRTSRTSRFQPLRNPSLRRLKTAFTTTSTSTATTAPTPSNAPAAVGLSSLAAPVSIFPPAAHQQHQNQSTSPLSQVTSPLSRASSPSSDLSSPSSTFSSISKASRFRALIMLRRKPSVADLEMEEERRSFSIELGLLEPRPVVEGLGAPGVVFGGIEDVLEGRS